MKEEKNILEEKLRSTPKQNEKIFKSKIGNSSSSLSSKKSYTNENTSIYKSSFHSQKATKHSLEHMERESKVTYLLDHDSSVNDNEKYEDIESFKKEAPIIYKEKVGQKMQTAAKANLIKEAVINVKPTTSIEDIEKTFKNLNKEFGGHFILAQSIHRDEGVFIDSKYDLKDLEYVLSNLSWRIRATKEDVTSEVIDYAPNRNIFYNKEDSSWYFDKEYKDKADISKFQKKINYHAHVLYSNFDRQTGRSAKLDRNDLRNLQTIVANSLGMQRGEMYSNAKRMNHWQLKRSIDAKREANLKSKNTLAKLKDLNKQVSLIRQELEENKFDRNSYAVLEQLKKDLALKVKAKELTIEELTMKLENYKIENERHRKTAGSKIKTKIVKVKEGLLKSKEVKIYDNKSVEGFVKETETKQKFLEVKNKDLEKENQKLNSFVYELRNHFKEFELDKLKDSIKSMIPKVEKGTKNISKSLDKGFER